jgi:hypothetical protein
MWTENLFEIVISSIHITSTRQIPGSNFKVVLDMSLEVLNTAAPTCGFPYASPKSGRLAPFRDPSLTVSQGPRYKSPHL